MKPIGLHLRWAETSAPVLSGACVVPNGSVFGNIINAVAGSSGSGKRGSSSSSASGDLVCSFGGRGSNSSQVLTVFNFGSTGETLKVPLTPFYEGGKKSDAMKSLPKYERLCPDLHYISADTCEGIVALSTPTSYDASVGMILPTPSTSRELEVLVIRENPSSAGSLEIADISRDKTTPAPLARSGFCSASLRNKRVFLFGGVTRRNLVENTDDATDLVYLNDLSYLSWNNSTSLSKAKWVFLDASLSIVGKPPSPRAWAAMATTNDTTRNWTLIIHGGFGPSGDCLSDIFIAKIGSPIACTWSNPRINASGGMKLPARASFGMHFLESSNELFIFGGCTTSAGTSSGGGYTTSKRNRSASGSESQDPMCAGHGHASSKENVASILLEVEKNNWSIKLPPQSLADVHYSPLLSTGAVLGVMLPQTSDTCTTLRAASLAAFKSVGVHFKKQGSEAIFDEALNKSAFFAVFSRSTMQNKSQSSVSSGAGGQRDIWALQVLPTDSMRQDKFAQLRPPTLTQVAATEPSVRSSKSSKKQEYEEEQEPQDDDQCDDSVKEEDEPPPTRMKRVSAAPAPPPPPPPQQQERNKHDYAATSPDALAAPPPTQQAPSSKKRGRGGALVPENTTSAALQIQAKTGSSGIMVVQDEARLKNSSSAQLEEIHVLLRDLQGLQSKAGFSSAGLLDFRERLEEGVGALAPRVSALASASARVDGRLEGVETLLGDGLRSLKDTLRNIASTLGENEARGSERQQLLAERIAAQARATRAETELADVHSRLTETLRTAAEGTARADAAESQLRSLKADYDKVVLQLQRTRTEVTMVRSALETVALDKARSDAALAAYLSVPSMGSGGKFGGSSSSSDAGQMIVAAAMKQQQLNHQQQHLQAQQLQHQRQDPGAASRGGGGGGRRHSLRQTTTGGSRGAWTGAYDANIAGEDGHEEGNGDGDSSLLR